MAEKHFGKFKNLLRGHQKSPSRNVGGKRIPLAATDDLSLPQPDLSQPSRHPADSTSVQGQSSTQIPSATESQDTPTTSMQPSEAWHRALEKVKENEHWPKYCQIAATKSLTSTKSIGPEQISEITDNLNRIRIAASNPNSSRLEASISKTCHILSSLNSIGTGLASLNPYASLAWRAVQGIISLVITYREAQEFCRQHLPLILEQTTRFHIIEEIYTSWQSSSNLKLRRDFELCLERVYISLVEYHVVIAVAMYSKATKLWTVLEGKESSLVLQAEDKLQKSLKEWGTLEPALNREIADFQFGQLNDYLQQIKDLGEMQTQMIRKAHQILDDKQRGDILEWISDIKYDDAHISKKRKIVKHTTDWVMAHESYKQWDSDITKSCLWIRGSMGCGKSYVIHGIIEDQKKRLTEKSDEFKLLYFYCDGTGAKTQEQIQSHDSILAALLKQLAEPRHASDKAMANSVVEMYNKKKSSQSHPTAEDCLDLMTSLAREDPSTQFRIIIDGLDECPTEVQEDLAQSLHILAKAIGDKFKLVLACRDNPDLIELLSKLDLVTASIPVKQYTQAAIRAMIHTRIEEDQKKSSRIEKFYVAEAENRTAAVVYQVWDHADGMFRWADAAITHLHSSPNFSTFESRRGDLGSLEGLFTLYDEIWDAFRARYDKKSQEALIAILNFLMYQIDLSPNWVRELRGDDVSTQDILDFVIIGRLPGSSSIEEVLSLCPAFLIRAEKWSKESVELVHNSVKEYLQQKRNETFGFVAGHMKLAELCIRLFLEPNALPEIVPEGVRISRNFVSYAVRAWVDHLKMLEDQQRLRKTPTIERFLFTSSVSDGFLKWVRWSDLADIPSLYQKVVALGWNSAAYLAISRCSPPSTFPARLYLDLEWQNFDASELKLNISGILSRDREGSMNAISFAAWIGNFCAVKWLVSQGFSPNEQDELGQNSGHSVAIAPQERIGAGGFALALRELLKHGLDISMKDKRGNTCFFKAIQGRNLNAEVLGIFIEQGVGIFESEPVPWKSVSGYQPAEVSPLELSLMDSISRILLQNS